MSLVVCALAQLELRVQMSQFEARIGEKCAPFQAHATASLWRGLACGAVAPGGATRARLARRAWRLRLTSAASLRNRRSLQTRGSQFVAPQTCSELAAREACSAELELQLDSQSRFAFVRGLLASRQEVAALRVLLASSAAQRSERKQRTVQVCLFVLVS